MKLFKKFLYSAALFFASVAALYGFKEVMPTSGPGPQTYAGSGAVGGVTRV